MAELKSQRLKEIKNETLGTMASATRALFISHSMGQSQLAYIYLATRRSEDGRLSPLLQYQPMPFSEEQKKNQGVHRFIE